MNRMKALQAQWKAVEQNKRREQGFPAPVSVKVLQKMKSDTWRRSELQCGAEAILRRSGLTQPQQHLAVGDFPTLLAFLDNHKHASYPRYLLCQLSEVKWITICILREKNNIWILIKDPQGRDLPPHMKEQLAQHFCQQKFSVKTMFNANGEIQSDLFNSFSSLTNMIAIVKKLRGNEYCPRLIENFNDPEMFCHQTDIGASKLEVIEHIKQDFLSHIGKCVYDLSGEKQFLEEMNYFMAFLEEFPCEEARKLCDSAMSSSVEDEGSLLSFRDHTSKILNDVKSKALYEKVKMDKNPQIRLNDDIANKYPSQVKKFHFVFEYLLNVENNEGFEKGFKEICSKLNMDHGRVEKFFSFKKTERKQMDRTSIQGDEAEVMAGIPHNILIQKINEIKCENLRENEAGIKDMDMILGEINYYEAVFQSCAEDMKVYLQDDFHRVTKCFEKWKDSDAADIKEHGEKCKQHYSSNNDIELIAVMDRANQLVTGGQRLRLPQILTVLTYLRRETDKGVLYQIPTGEGKTLIISMLAVIKAFRGHTVDVVTTNSVLASQAVADRELFYALFGLQVAHNNQEECPLAGPRLCYRAHVVYGCISSFQFDYLRDVFEGNKTRSGRRFDSIILDEVDSMLVDNGGQIAKLSSHFPGMATLKYFYIDIWKKLHSLSDDVIKMMVDDNDKKIDQLTKELNSGKITKNEFDTKVHRVTWSNAEILVSKLKDIIKIPDPAAVSLLASHLKSYVDTMFEKWIANAIYAKYYYREYVHYSIKEVGGERRVVPIDYAHTGSTLRNTVWTHGLHQFIQLKHNLRLCCETLTSSCVSNFHYIRLYEGSVCGLSGTLGSAAERQLLSSIYKLIYVHIPTYKTKKFKELPEIVAENESSWCQEILAEIKCKVIEEKRAVLVIFETQADLMVIDAAVQKSGMQLAQFLRYRDESDSQVSLSIIQSEALVLATNIAGRGADFRTSAVLEAQGGLHVCVAFLPANQRVKQQAQHRTARQGNHGTARLLLHAQHLQRLHLPTHTPGSFQQIQHSIDQAEVRRIREIREKKVIELHFQDQLFACFAEFYREQKQYARYSAGHQYILQDLKEHFAFWVEKLPEDQHFKQTWEETFDSFRNDPMTQEIVNGKIKHNPFYSIQQAEYFMKAADYKRAKKALLYAVQLSANPEILHSAYIKLYEVAMRDGHVILNKVRSALSDILGWKVAEQNNQYKDDAKLYLDKAQMALNTEIKYLESIFECAHFQNIIIGQAEGQENLFLKHFSAKRTTLHIYASNVAGLQKIIGNSSDAGVAISSRIANYLESAKPDAHSDEERQVLASLTQPEVQELASVGLDTLQDARVVSDVSEGTVTAVRNQIGVGLALLGSGGIFPPATLFAAPLSCVLISEGISDLVVELLGEEPESTKSYMNRKLLVYGMSVLTLGVSSAVFISETYIGKAIETYNGLISILSKSNSMVFLCQNIAKFLEVIRDSLVFVQCINLSKVGSKEMERFLISKIPFALGTITAGFAWYLFQNKKHLVDPSGDGDVSNAFLDSKLDELNTDNESNSQKSINYTSTEELQSLEKLLAPQATEDWARQYKKLRIMGNNAWENGFEAEKHDPAKAAAYFNSSLQHYTEALALCPQENTRERSSMQQRITIITSKIQGDRAFEEGMNFQDMASDNQDKKQYVDALFYCKKALQAYESIQECSDDGRIDAHIRTVKDLMNHVQESLQQLDVKETIENIKEMTLEEYKLSLGPAVNKVNNTILQHETIAVASLSPNIL